MLNIYSSNVSLKFCIVFFICMWSTCQLFWNKRNPVKLLSLNLYVNERMKFYEKHSAIEKISQWFLIDCFIHKYRVIRNVTFKHVYGTILLSKICYNRQNIVGYYLFCLLHKIMIDWKVIRSETYVVMISKNDSHDN